MPESLNGSGGLLPGFPRPTRMRGRVDAGSAPVLRIRSMAIPGRKIIKPQGARVMERCRDSQFFLEPQQALHRQYEALRAVFVEGQPLESVAPRFGYKLTPLRSMVSHFRAARRCGDSPPFFARTAADGPAGHRRAEAVPLPKSPRSPTPGS